MTPQREREDSISPHQEPLLDLSQSNMKRVYWLSDDLKNDPQRVELTQALTQNKDKPHMGLKGTHGLFASPEWWNNINRQKMPLDFVSGTVIRAYEAGQDRIGINNTVELRLVDGTIRSVGIYVNKNKTLLTSYQVPK